MARRRRRRTTGRSPLTRTATRPSSTASWPSLLVVVAALTGGDVPVRALVAAVFFVVATAWSWWRFRERIKERDGGSERRLRAARRRSGSANGNGARGRDVMSDVGRDDRGALR